MLPTLFVGEGRGRVCVNWKTPQKFKSIPRLFSMICLHPAYYGQFSCQESVNRNQEIKQSAMDMQ